VNAAGGGMVPAQACNLGLTSALRENAAADGCFTVGDRGGWAEPSAARRKVAEPACAARETSSSTIRRVDVPLQPPHGTVRRVDHFRREGLRSDAQSEIAMPGW
jgi:hypothetical protein